MNIKDFALFYAVYVQECDKNHVQPLNSQLLIKALIEEMERREKDEA